MSLQEEIELTLNSKDPNLEEVACRFIGHSDAQNGIQFLVARIKSLRREDGAKPSELMHCLDLLAFLLLYEVIEPLQLLQACIYTNDYNCIRICGTEKFESDVIQHLKLTTSVAQRPKHADLVSVNNKVAFVDFLKKEKKSTDQKESNLHIHLRDSKTESTTRKLLHGSMTADEAAMKIEKNFYKFSQVSVLQGILSACCELKLYNRLFGSVVGKLIDKNSQLWYPALLTVVSEILNGKQPGLDQVYKLKLVGTWIGHLICSDALSMSDFFSMMSLDQERSTPSSRIMFVAVLEEMKAELGKTITEERILSDELHDSIRNVMEPELAAGFWKLVGFDSVSKCAETYKKQQYVDAEFCKAAHK